MKIRYLLRMFGLQTQEDTIADRTAMPKNSVIHIGQSGR
jgi:hypothetical protein